MRKLSGFCRLWNLSIVSLILLTSFNCLLLMRLFQAPSCEDGAQHRLLPKRAAPADVAKQQARGTENKVLPQQQQQQQQQHHHHRNGEDATRSSIVTSHQQQQQQQHVYINGSEEEFRFRMYEGRWDQTRQYRIHDFVVTGDEWMSTADSSKACMATQTSLDRLFWLIQAARHWGGPVSVALFTPDIEFGLAKYYIRFMRKCYRSIRDLVSFHFVFPVNRPPTDTIDLSTASLPCEKPESNLRWLLNKRTASYMRWRETLPYPQNHLRNVARKNCVAKKVFLTDVDIIPSFDAHRKLSAFIEQQDAKPNKCANCAYVIPTYEVFERAPFPRTKSELLALVKQDKARPFHKNVFVYNQFATNFSRWERSSEEGPVRISHDVTNFEFFYEPFYVADDSVAPHDERFVGYGFTRNTQVYEMFLAGSLFKVLTPMFTVHWGLQKRKGRPTWRERQNVSNRNKFETFKKELQTRYGGRDPLHMMVKDSKKNRR